MRAHSASRSRWVIGLSFAALTALGSTFWALLAKAPNPVDIQARFQAELETIRKLPPGELARKDAYLEELLTDPQWKHALSLRKQVEKEHAIVHEAARLDKQAAQDVPPFLRKVEIARRSPAEFRTQASLLRDEARALWERYATTSYGPTLDALLKELEVLTCNEGGWEPHWVPLQKSIGDLKKQRNFKEAFRILEEFGVRHRATDDPSLDRKIQTERASIAREAAKTPR